VVVEERLEKTEAVVPSAAPVQCEESAPAPAEKPAEKIVEKAKEKKVEEVKRTTAAKEPAVVCAPETVATAVVPPPAVPLPEPIKKSKMVSIAERVKLFVLW
jgi:hypothetical protein